MMKSIKCTLAQHDSVTVFYWILFGIVLLTGAAAMLIGLGSFDCSGDEYNAIHCVRLGFFEYIKQFPYGLFLKIQFWICDRVFGGTLPGYRIPGAVAGILNILIIMILAMRLWPARRGLPLLVGLFLAFNTTVWTFCRWGMAVYGESILLGAAMLWLFLGLVERRLSWRWLGPVVLLFIASPYINFTSLISWFSGALALVFLSNRANRSTVVWIRPIAAAWEFKYFLIIPLIFLFARLMDPNWDFYANRSGLHPSFFALKENSHDFYGLCRFMMDKYQSLIFELVRITYPVQSERESGRIVNLAFSILYVFVLPLGVLLPFERGRLSRQRLFLSCYFLVSLLLIGFLGVMGRFPFGQARYSLWLVDAAVLLMALGVGDIVYYLCIVPGGWLFRKAQFFFGYVSLWRGATVLGLASLCFVAVLGMAGASAWLSDMREQERKSYDRLFGILKSENADMVILDKACSSWMQELFPNILFNHAKIISFGQKASKLMMADLNNTQIPVNTILIVTYNYKGMWEMADAELEYRNHLPSELFAPMLTHIAGRYQATRLERIKPIPTTNTPAAPKILAWGPQSMLADKLGSMWVKAENITPRTVIMREGYELRSLPTPGVITAFTGEDCFPAAGKYELYLFDQRTGLRSQSVYMTIVPPAKK